jgi:hypothetical protein
MENKCENCKNYRHTPNILGGIAECLIEEKYLNTFWDNEACSKFKGTESDNLKPQREFMIEHLGDTLNIKKFTPDKN